MFKGCGYPTERVVRSGRVQIAKFISYIKNPDPIASGSYLF